MAIKFTGETGDALLIPKWATTQSFTAMIWVKFTVINAWHNIFYFEKTGAGATAAQINSSGTLYSYGATGSTLTTDVWYHVALVNDASSSSGSTLIYLNGTLDITDTVENLYGDPATHCYIGRWAAANDPPQAVFAGFKLFLGRQLTADQIKQEMRYYKPVDSTGLYAACPMLYQDRLLDISGNGNSLTVSGSLPDDDQGPPIAWSPARSRLFSQSVGECTSPIGGVGDSVTFAVNNPGGEDTCLVVVTHTWHATNGSINGITFDTSQNFTQYATLGAVNDDRIEVWRLLNPHTGTHDVVIDFVGSGIGYKVACWVLTGVDQTTPLAGVVTNTTPTSPSSLNVTTVAGDLVLDALSVAADVFGSKQVGLNQVAAYGDAVSEPGAGSKEVATGTTTTMSWSWTGSSSWLKHLAFAVKQAGAAVPITPVFSCGFECGVGINSHISQGGGTSPAFSTSLVRSGARSARFNVSSSSSFFAFYAYSANSPHIGRAYIRFEGSLPSADTGVVAYDVDTNGPNIRFKQSDGKLYAAVGTTFGATGVAITTGQWYRIDYKFVQENAANDTCDGKVDGTALGQATATGLSSGNVRDSIGIMNSCTADMYVDDVIMSQTAPDYPIGPGYVNHFIAVSDGAHNIAGGGDFQRGNTGVDILNTTTDAYLLIDDVPLPSGTVDQADNWRAVAPANPTTDYVESVFGPAPGISTPTVAPRAVEVVLAHHQIATQNGRMVVQLNDNGTTDTVFDTGVSGGVVTYRYARKHYVSGPAGPWVIGGGGNGDFTDLRCRFLAPDAAPDQCLDAIMIEAEFPEAGVSETDGSASGTGMANGIAGATRKTEGTSAGTAVVTGAAAGILRSEGSAAGIGTASGQAAIGQVGVGQANGIGAANGVGAAQARTEATASGIGAATGVGAGRQLGEGSAVGSAVVNGIGAARFEAAGSAVGVGAAQGESQVGNEVETEGTAAGVGTANAVGAAQQVADGSASGVGTAQAVGAGRAMTEASAAGNATASGVGSAVVVAEASAAGIGAANGAGASRMEVDGAAQGVGAASGIGAGQQVAEGSSVGAGVAAGVGAAVGMSEGAASGVAVVSGVTGRTAKVEGTAAGVGTALGVGEDASGGFVYADGTAAGISTAQAVGAGFVGAAGSAAGLAIAAGVGAARLEVVGVAVGTGQVDGVAAFERLTSGSASGAGAAVSVGASFVLAGGIAAGVGTALGEGKDGSQGDIVETTGVAAGVALVLGVSNVPVQVFEVDLRFVRQGAVAMQFFKHTPNESGFAKQTADAPVFNQQTADEVTMIPLTEG